MPRTVYEVHTWCGKQNQQRHRCERWGYKSEALSILKACIEAHENAVGYVRKVKI